MGNSVNPLREALTQVKKIDVGQENASFDTISQEKACGE